MCIFDLGQGRLNSIIDPGQNSALGPLPTQPLTGMKMQMIIKIKHILFIVLVLPTKSVFINIK